MQGQAEAAIACEVEHEKFGQTRLTITLRPDGRELVCDGEKVTRMADYLGRFPTVVFTSQDLLLVRGAPAGRRRWLDLTLAAMDGAYLRALQTYHRALAERNSVLKRGAAAAELEAFEHSLAPAGAELIARRATALAELGALTRVLCAAGRRGRAGGARLPPEFCRAVRRGVAGAMGGGPYAGCAVPHDAHGPAPG
jgi:DNA replication and repair protein RecF